MGTITLDGESLRWEDLRVLAGPGARLRASSAALRKCRRVLERVREIVGLELLCAAQGLDFLEPLRPGRRVAAAHAALRRGIPTLKGDRFVRPEIARITSPESALPEAILRAAGPQA